MSIHAGLVGLPNVGKSTLFNALTKAGVPAENYPFCTIEPCLAITNVPDERLEQLAKIYGSQKLIPATVTFVDIAGLVKGAASGEGLGNQFLSHIQGVHLILHVVRCFADENIIYSGDELDPISDFNTIQTELMLKDIESVSRRQEKVSKLIKAVQNKPQELKELLTEQELLTHILAALEVGNATRVRELMQSASVSMIPLLSAKDFLIIANIGEEELEQDAYKNNVHYQALVRQFGQERVIPICAKIEMELVQLAPDEAQEMMNLLGMRQTSLSTIIKKTYDHLGLITFFTCGPKEAHAWPIKKNTTIKRAAGEIHSDLERGFICAEVFNYRDIMALGSEAKVRDAGRLRIEGQHYLTQDGDIVHIRFNV